MTNAKLRDQAQALRKNGYSYSMIFEKLGVPKGTLSYWLSDISYTPNQKVLDRIKAGREKTSEAATQRKRKSLLKARKLAEIDVGHLDRRDLFMLGLGLYMGEGKKSHYVGVVNSDKRIICSSMRWFIECFDLTVDNFTLAIHLYPDNDIEECLEYWSRATNIPKERFQKTQIDERTNKKMAKRGKLRYGTAHLTVVSHGGKEFGSMALLLRRINAQMESALSKAGLV